MVFDSLSFLDLSEKLYSDCGYTCEATTRTIISRSYYAIFLFMRGKLKVYFQEDFSKRRQDVHQQMIEFLKGSGFPLSFIGDLLFDLREKRNDADYDCHKIMKNKDSISAINMAKEIESEMSSSYPS